MWVRGLVAVSGMGRGRWPFCTDGESLTLGVFLSCFKSEFLTRRQLIAAISDNCGLFAATTVDVYDRYSREFAQI